MMRRSLIDAVLAVGAIVLAGAFISAVLVAAFAWVDRDHDAEVRRKTEASCAAVATADDVEGCVTVCGEVPDPADRSVCVVAFNRDGQS